MEILDVELREYAAADSMTITTTATGVTPEEDTTIRASVVLDVDVNVDGALGCSVPVVANVAENRRQPYRLVVHW